MTAVRRRLAAPLALALLVVLASAGAATAGSHAQAARANGYDIAIQLTPAQPKVGEATTLDVTVTHDGAPVTGLFMHLEASDGATHSHTSTGPAPGTYRFDIPAGFSKGGDIILLVGFTKGGVDTEVRFVTTVTGGGGADTRSLFAMGLVMVHGTAALALIGGTLLVFALLWRNQAEGELATLIARRYTLVAWASLAALYLTGFLRLQRLGLSLGDYFTTSYGVVMSVKVFLALLVTLYLAYVSARLVPALAARAHGDSPREFRLMLLGQLVLFATLLGLVQVLFMSHGGSVV